MKDRFIIVGILLLTNLLVKAQAPSDEYLGAPIEQRTIDEKKWTQAIEGIDYTESDVAKKKRKKREEEDRYDDMRDPPNPIVGAKLLGNIAIFLGVLALIILLAFLLRNLLGVEIKPRDKKIKKKAGISAVTLSSIEENIHETDLENYIEEALKEGQFALAVRLYYLAILKAFSEAKLIQWKRDKTNRQYLYEVRKTPYASSFAEATHIFEWAWYSEHELSESDYRKLEPTFKNIVKEVKGNK